MTILTAPDSDYRRVVRALDELGLAAYANEIDAQGYTVVPPHLLGDDTLRHRLLEGVLAAAERADGERPDLETGAPYVGIGHHGRSIGTLLGQDPVFAEALMNPAVLAFASYLCGYSCVLNALTGLVKGPGGGELELHADAQIALPVYGPLPPYAVVANCTIPLTDYTRDNGCLAVVPGSHKWQTPASGPAAQLLDNPDAVAVECPAGSLVVWHGNLWHGAYPRANEGLRAAVVVYFARHFLRTQENWVDRAPLELVERYGERFAQLTGQAIRFGYSSMEEADRMRARAGKWAPPRSTVNFADVPSLWS